MLQYLQGFLAEVFSTYVHYWTSNGLTHKIIIILHELIRLFVCIVEV
jgi:hypothetical protein